MTRQSLIDANKRRLVCYPNKRNLAIYIAMCKKFNKKKGELIHEMLKNFLSRLTLEQQDEYLKLYHSMNADE